MDTYIKNKIRRTRPRYLEALQDGADPIRVDMSSTSTQEAYSTLDAVPWESLRALDAQGNVVWMVQRDDLDSDSDPDPDPDPKRAAAPVGTPESWLAILIRAQEAATRAQTEALTVLVDALQASHQRSQEMLDQAHKIIVRQQEQIDELQQAKGGSDLIEQLAPVVAPLLMQGSGSGSEGK